MTENEFKYWAFLSYSPLDNTEQRLGDREACHLRWADRLREALKSFPVPAEFVGQPNSRGEIIPDRIGAVYQHEAAPADAASLSAEARLALEQSRCLIVICSPRSAQSAAVNEAVQLFKQLGRGNRILPVVVAGEPNTSDDSRPGIAPEAECFAPAMRYPVLPDGLLDTTRRDVRYFFADARFGAERSEISTKTELLAETELAIAKIHLLSGVLGVGFYGLWQREQKRRFVGFAEAQQQVREVQSQFEFARDQAQSAQAQLQALQAQARETMSQLEAAQQEVREAQNKLLANQNLPPDVHTQIREAQDKALDAHSQTQAMQNQLEALQAQSRAIQEQLESARQEVQAAEQKSLESQQQARIAQAQVEQARQQARETQQQLEAARQQVRETQEKALAVQAPSGDTQPQVQELQNQLRAAQAQVETAVFRAEAAEANLVATQTQARTAEAQLEEARQEVRGAHSKIAEAQQQTKFAQDQGREVQNQTREIQAQIQNAQKQVADAKQQACDVQETLSSTQGKIRAAQRLTKVFAVLAVLAALAVGVVLLQRKAGSADVAKTSTTDLSLGASTNQLDSAQIRQALEQARDLDSFTTRIPKEKIPETLDLAATILADPQRSRLQEQLLDVWVQADAVAVFDWSRQLTNAETRQLSLAKIIPALATDSTNALAAFDWLQSQTNSEALPAGTGRDVILTSLFKNWAANDLDAAATASEQLTENATKARVARIILSQRIAHDPSAAAGVVTNLPPGDFRQKAIVELSQRWGGSDATNALSWTETLPGESDRAIAIHQIVTSWAQADLSAATNWATSLSAEKKDAALLILSTPWAQLDAKGLADYAFTLPAGEVQTRCLMEVCRAGATNDFARTVELLQPLTNNIALRQNLLGQAARESELPRVSATADFIATMPTGDDQQAAIKGLVAQWAGLAPEPALYWLRTFPETNAQPAQIEFVLQTWAQTEPAAAAQWLTNQPSDATTEAMASAFLAGAVVKYPEFAVQWTQSVADETQRQKFQVQVAQQWLKHDAGGAQKWIETLELPAKLKKALK